ncbi:MAG: Gfo/Idh/MocA family oxidoreductase [Cephaloticoccus sp.]|nr:Gfo/Idh/MocA family oxidoreductase [Cephaloticoccus sp.]MCF7759572.1 Gfo/Idh/MocA family oxidoreductase [Cephaloticoccus sp.]
MHPLVANHRPVPPTLVTVDHWLKAYGTGRKLRLAIVGARFGGSFQFHEHPNCTVVAVADLDAAARTELMNSYRCSTGYATLDEVVADPRVEAVFLATPAPLHAGHSIQCLAAGKHVLSAVPAAMTLVECAQLAEAVKRSGLIYMMAETSYWQQHTISARKFYEDGAFGNLFYVESEYHHAGLEHLYFQGEQRTWRHGMAPMQYPTHCTAHLVGVTGERLTEVTCIGWGDGHPILQDNSFKNPFWNETALFKTNRGNAMRVAVWWRGAQTGGERARYFGDKMSFYHQGPNGNPTCTVHAQPTGELDAGGFVRSANTVVPYEQVQWWQTDLLPPPLRHDSGHEGSHSFITHEFVDAVLKQRQPRVDVYTAIACTAPGIVAHQSALQGGVQLPIPSFDPSPGTA